MSDQVMVEDHQAQPSLSIRMTTSHKDLPDNIGKAYGQIMQYMAELGQEPANVPYVGYFNQDMANLEVEIGMPTTTALPAKGEVQSTEIPAGKYAAMTHTGPYDTLMKTYQKLSDWLDSSKYQMAGAAYEFYMNDPGEVKPEELQTVVAFLVK